MNRNDYGASDIDDPGQPDMTSQGKDREFVVRRPDRRSRECAVIDNEAAIPGRTARETAAQLREDAAHFREDAIQLREGVATLREREICAAEAT